MTYIERLTKTVQDMHQCRAKHVRGIPITERYQGQIVWSGIVELFNLEGHPKTGVCYAWAAKDGDKENFTAVLKLPPVDSPETAVRAAIMSQIKK